MNKFYTPQYSDPTDAPRAESFKEWLAGDLIQESVRFYGGKNKGWTEYPSIDKIPDWWWGFISKKLAEKPDGWVPDIEVDGTRWSRKQVIDHINMMTGGGQSQSQDAPQQQSQVPQGRVATPASSGKGQWLLATAVEDEELEDYHGIPHKIKKGQYVALKKNDDREGSWTYVTIWKGKLQWHNYHMSQEELPKRFKRFLGKDGKTVQGPKASDLAKSTYKEEKKSFELTDEQQDIADRFKQMKDGEDDDHMVIPALAGTGKTTMLKHLAENFGKEGEKWLYLVFGTKNREEAVEDFPTWMKKHIFTTNSYAGRVLESNNVKPTERIADYAPAKNTSKIREILDGNQYRAMIKDLDVPHFEDPGMSNYIGGYMKNIWREFNKEVEKLTGLAKSYNLSPENATEGIKKIAEEHDINTSLEQTKERLEKDGNSDFFNEQISEFMGLDNFASEDFLERMIQASVWLLKSSQPHGIDQEFMQTHKYDKRKRKWTKLDKPVKRNLKTLRDFNDDLWYAAQHADELDWSKPQKYKYVLVDEVQDFNISQKVLLQKLIENGARVVAVGDKNQGMYRFRGADDNALKDITSMLIDGSKNKDSVVKPLTMNFRSKQGIIDHANENTVVNDLRAGREHDPDDPAYVSDQELKYDDTIDRLGDEMRSLGEMKKQTAFIARTNEPLAKAAMDLLKHKIPFIIYGKDLANDVVGLVNRVMAWGKWKNVNDDSNLNEFRDELDEFVDKKKEDWGGQSRKIGHLQDLLEAQQALHASIEVAQEQLKSKDIPSYEDPHVSVKDFKKWLKKRLGGSSEDMSRDERIEHKRKMEKENPVILTTAHKAKGLEFERVFELTPSMYPHPRTKLDADFEQEENARYVAKTRAKDEYHVVDDSKEE